MAASRREALVSALDQAYAEFEGLIAETIPGNSYEHVREHAGEIRRWLAVGKNSPAG